MKDQKLLELVAERERLRERASTLGAKADTLGRKIITEMERRNIKALEGDGLRVNLVSPENTSVDNDLLKTLLRPVQWKAITVQVVDKKLLSEQVQNGRIPLAAVNRASTVIPGKPYLRVSHPGS